MIAPWLSIIVPVFNEATTLNELLARLNRVCGQLADSGKSSEIVLVDDGSSDTSPSLIRAAAQSQPMRVRGVFLNRNYGQHAAIMAGFAHAQGDVLVTLDADLQNPPEEIPKLLGPIDEGCDVVGSRRLNRQDHWLRRLFSTLVNRAVRASTGVSMTDYGCMLRAYRRPVVEAMLQSGGSTTFIPVLANQYAHQTAEVPVRHAGRENSTSKYTPLKLVNLLFDLLTSMTTAPLRLLSLVGIGLALFGFVLALSLMLARVFFGPDWAADGVFTLFAALFFLIGAQFVGLGLVGEYVGRIFHDVRGRPRYLVKEVVESDETKAKIARG